MHICYCVWWQLAGVVPLVFGILALVDEDLLEKAINTIPGTEEIAEIVDITELGKNFAVTFIVLGSVIVVIGIFGFCGACCNNQCMLGVVRTCTFVVGTCWNFPTSMVVIGDGGTVSRRPLILATKWRSAKSKPLAGTIWRILMIIKGLHYTRWRIVMKNSLFNTKV